MKICEAGRSSGCCKNPDIRTINTMSADTAGNFEIRAGAGVGITTETNGIRIAYTGGLIAYSNTDGNLDIDNANFIIDLANDISIVGDASVGGNMTITGDLTVNGTYYTVHAEHVYTEDDYIIMRDGAVTGLGSGDFSGFQVKLYDGVNDGRLVIDNTGTARVGDVGNEQPLLTREESANMTDGALLKWDAGNSKAVDEGTVGSDTKPIKIVNGVPTAVTNDLGIVNSTDIYNETVTAGLGAITLMNKSVSSAGTYLIVAQIEIANAPVGTAILGIGKTANIGWGISKTNTGTDYVRLTMCSVQVMNATDQAYANFYNGFGSNQSVNCRMTLTKLA